jgi:hypothetical protein
MPPRCPRRLIRVTVLALGVLLAPVLMVQPAEATGITFSQFVAAAATQDGPPAALPAASPSVARWGWSGRLPGGYSPAIYAYAVDVLAVILSPTTLPLRSTVMLTTSGDSAQPGRSVWLLNSFAPAPRVDAAFLARELQVVIWKSLYDGLDDAPATGVAAARTVRYLSGLYRLPVGDQAESWHGVVQQHSVLSRRDDARGDALYLLAIWSRWSAIWWSGQENHSLG